MPTDRPSARDVVLDAWARFATADPAILEALFTDDVEWIAPADNASARRMGGVHHFVGRAAVVDFLARLFPAVFVADVAVRFTGVHACGDVVIVEETMTATLVHGGHYSNDYCFVFEVADRRIRRVREYMDTRRGEFWFSVPRNADGTQRRA